MNFSLIRIHFLKRFLPLAVICLFAIDLQAAVTVSAATGGTNISADNAANATSPAYTTLSDIVITELANGDFSTGTNRTLILTAPAGWSFEAGVGSVSYMASRNITAASIAVTSTTITVTYSLSQTNRIDIVTISGIRVRADDGANVTGAGNILRTAANPGTGVIAGITNGTTNFGSLSQTAGAMLKLVVTLPGQTFTDGTTLAGSGNSGTPSNQTSGTAFNLVTFTATDQFFNVITSYSGAKTVSYTGPSNGLTAPSYTTSVNFTSGISTTTLATTLKKAETTTITASDGTISGPASSSLTVVAGALSNYLVESSSGGNIGTQTVNSAFTIKVTARDAENNTVTGFTGTVVISATGTLSAGSGTTASFTAGVLGFHSVNFSNSGDFTITATNSAGAQTGTSNTFTVAPYPVISTISPDSKTTCDGAFTMTVNGSNFNASSVVRINGSNRTTTFVNSGQLTASILAGDLSSAGTFDITVNNVSPLGLISNAATFTVNAAVPVSVSIAASPTGAICAGTNVTFTATPTNGGTTPSYQWKIGTTNVGTNSDTYSSTSLANGEVVTCVMTSNLGGCLSNNPATSNAIAMTVNPLPSAGIAFAETSGTSNNDGTICEGTSVTLTANPTSGMTYSWAAPISASGNNQSVAPSSTTSYTVTVTNSTTNCSASTSASVTVNTNPSPTITFAETSGTANNDGTTCSGDAVTLTANPTSGMAYSWAAPIGTTGNNKAVSPTSTTAYTVTVTNSSTACFASVSASVVVNANPSPTVTFSETSGTANNDGTVCNGDVVTLTALPASGVTYAWSAPGGTSDNIVVSPSSTSSYSVTVTDGAIACSASVSALVTVNTLPTPTITFAETSGTSNNDGTICEGTSVTLTANPTSGMTYNWAAPIGATGNNKVVSPASTTAYTVTVTNSSTACFASVSASVNVNTNPSPTITFSETSGTTNDDGITCSGDNVTLTANPTSGMTYSWSAPISATGNNKTVSPTSTTSYTVTVTNSSTACFASVSASVTVNSISPIISFSETSGTANNDGTVCNGDAVTLTVSPSSGVTYAWSSPGGSSDNIVVSPSSTTFYSVTVTDATIACSASASASVTVNALPIPTITFAETSGTGNNDGTICEGTSVTLIANPTSGMTYSWAAPISAGGNNKIVSPTSTTAYTVTVTNSSTACSASVSAAVTVNANPSPTISFSETSGTTNNDGITCAGASVTLTATPVSGVTYNWSSPGGTADNIVVSPVSTTAYTVSVTETATACSASVSTSVTVNALPSPTITFAETSGTTNNDGTICEGTSVTLTANPTSGMTYNWAAPISSSGNNQSVSPAVTTAYTVTVTNSTTACSASASTSVIVNTNPSPTITYTETSGTTNDDGIICSGDNVTLIANPTGGMTYAWAAPISASGNNKVVSPTSTASYSVTVTNSSTACSTSVSTSVTVNTNPSPTITFAETSGTTNDDGEICSGDAVTLTANPTSGMTYNWAAPIGTSGNDKIVSPTATTVYTVTVTNSSTGCFTSVSASVTIDAVANPTIAFSETSGTANNDGNICEGTSVTLTANPTSGMTYSWAAPISASGNNQSVSPAATTAYTVTVTNSTTGCSASASTSVTVNANPSPTITFGETSGTANNDGAICEGTSVTLTANPTSGMTYSWAAPISASGNNKVVSPASTTAYTVTITNSSTACFASVSASVIVNANPSPTISFTETTGTTNNDGIICNGDAVTLTASPSSGVTYSWSSPGGTTDNIVVSPTSTTGYSVTVTETATACSASASTSVTVNSLPTPTITFTETSGTANNDGTICEGTSVTLTANPTSGMTYSWAAPISASGNGKVVSPASTTGYTVTVTNSTTACSASASTSVTVNTNPVPTITYTETSGTANNDGAICEGTSVTLTANPISGMSYSWSAPISATGNNKVVNPTSTTAYTVTVTNSTTACFASVTASVTVNTLPSPTISFTETTGTTNNDGIICNGDAVTLTASPSSGVTYSWSSPGGTADNIVVSPASTTGYGVTVTETATACSASVSTSVTVNSLPSPTITFTETSGTASNDGIVCEGTSVTLTANPTSGMAYSWAAPISASGNNKVVSPTSTTVYAVTVTNSTNACSASASTSVTVNANPSATITFIETSGTTNDDGIVCSGDAVTLTANPTSGMTFSWAAPISASGNNKVVSPTSTTAYTVTVTNSSTACLASVSASVIVNSVSPTIAFTETTGTTNNDGTICNGDAVTLTASPSSGVTYSWSAPGGTSDNIVVSPSSTTSYTVTVTETATACSASASVSVVVNTNPSPTITFAETSGSANNDGTICEGTSVTLTANPTSGMSYSWSAPISAGGNNKVVSPASTTGYTVTVTNSTTACSATTSTSVNVNTNPSPTITYTETSGTTNNDGIICSGDAVTLTANPVTGMAYSWSAPISATGNNKVVSPTSTTAYTVTVTNSTTNCFASISASVTVNTLPSPAISVAEASGTANNDGTICVGTSVTLTANPTSGMSYSWAAPISATGNDKVVSPAATTAYAVTVTNTNACSATASRTITVNPLPTPTITFTETSGSASNDGITCTGASVTLVANPTTGSTYAWSSPPGGTGNNKVVAPTATTSYTVTVTTTATACAASVSATVTVNPFPVPSITFTETSGTTNNDGTICNGTSVTLTANPTTGMNYVWSSPPGGTANNVSVSPSANTTYRVTVTDGSSSCSASASATVVVNANPSPTIGVAETSGTTNNDGTTCSGATVTLTATPATGMSYSWAAPISATGNGKVVNPTSTTAYVVTVTNSTSACSATATRTITVNAPPTPTITFTESSGIANNDGSICSGSVTLTANPTTGMTYTWANPPGGTGNNKVVTPATTTNYSVTVTQTSTACSATVGATVVKESAPTASISVTDTTGLADNDGTICSGWEAILTASPTSGMNYYWSDPLDTTGNNHIVTPTANTTYTVTVTNASTGCSATASRTITVSPVVTADAWLSGGIGVGIGVPGGSICDGDVINFHCTVGGNSGYDFLWSGPLGWVDNSRNVNTSNLDTFGTGMYYVTSWFVATGCFGRDSIYVIVHSEIPAPDFPISNSPQCADVGVTISKTGTPPSGVQWYWQTSPTGTSLADSNATYTVYVSGTYYLRAYNYNYGCWSDTARPITVVVYPLPPATVTFLESSGTASNDGRICIGITTTVMANPDTGMTYNWAAPISAIGNNHPVSPAVSTAYGVTVTNATTGCSATASGTLIVDTLPVPTITFSETNGTTNNDGISCPNAAVTLIANPTTGMNYNWAAPISATGNNKVVTPAATTSYTVTVTNSTTICSASTSATVTVNPAPIPTITYAETSGLSNNDGTICNGHSVTLTANPTTGITSYTWAAPISATGNNKVVSPASTTSYTVTVVETATVCSASTSATVTVVAVPTPTISVAETSGAANNDGAICNGHSVTLTANPTTGATYVWASPPGGTANGVSVSPTATTAYVVTVTSTATNCSATSTRNIMVDALPTPTITYSESSGVANNDGIICRNAQVTLIANPTSGMSYSWAAPISSTGNNKTVAPTSTTTYTVTVTNSTTLCAASVSATVTVNMQPTITITYTDTSGTTINDGKVCAGNSVKIKANSGSGNTHSWSTGATADSIIVTPFSTTAYTVISSNPSTVCLSQVSANVQVDPLPTPNAILADCMFVDSAHIMTTTDTNFVIVTGSGGTAPYTFDPPANGEFRFSINASQKVFTVPANGNSHSHRVKDNNNCSANASIVSSPTSPTNIPFTSTSGVETATCYDRSFNKWLTFKDTSNLAIASIYDDSLDLGIVSVTVYKDTAEPTVVQQNIGMGCDNWQSTALRRHFVITSTTPQPFARDVKVRLYFTDDELESLKTVANGNNISNNPCTTLDDVADINSLYITKYGDSATYTAAVDGDFNNNHPIGSGGIYKLYGSPSSSYAIPNGQLDKNATGFAAIYPSAVQSHHYVELSVRDFSEFWIHGSTNSTPLPVEMIFFEAEGINNEYIQLRWATAVEIVNRGFQVERSIDGQTWNIIGWVDGNNNTTSRTDYSYDDRTAMQNVRYYYRLKQLDYDGQFEYTDLVTAIIYAEAAISIKGFVPNPAADNTTLLITTRSEQNITVEMYDVIGQKVLSSVNRLNKGTNQIPFDVSRLAAGTYTAIVKADGLYTQKLVITK